MQINARLRKLIETLRILYHDNLSLPHKIIGLIQEKNNISAFLYLK